MKSNVFNAEGITRSLGLVLLLTSLAAAKPATYDEYFALESDVTSMESLPRGVRQPAPSVFASEIRDLLVAGNEPKKIHGKQKPFKNASGKTSEGGFFKTYGSDADGIKGYEKEAYGKGDHGYKILDTFHKQNGNNYGFEKHTSFGHDKGGEKESQHAKKGSNFKKDGDHEGSATIVESHYGDNEGDGGYSEGGDGEYYSGGSGGSYEGGSGESDSGNYGSSDGYSEHYSSGEGEGEGESEGGYSEGESEGDSDGGYYEGDY